MNNYPETADGFERLRRIGEDLDACQATLIEVRGMIDRLDRRAEISQALCRAGAIDLQETRLMIEGALSLMDDPDVVAAVERLKRDRPEMFRDHR